MASLDKGTGLGSSVISFEESKDGKFYGLFYGK